MIISRLETIKWMNKKNDKKISFRNTSTSLFRVAIIGAETKLFSHRQRDLPVYFWTLVGEIEATETPLPPTRFLYVIIVNCKVW